MIYYLSQTCRLDDFCRLCVTLEWGQNDSKKKQKNKYNTNGN